jgi:ABC-type nitrate/sulfonate/bicarbonate transport system permease component
MGFVVASGQQVLDPSQVLGAVIILSIVALIVDRLIWKIEQRFTAWRL